MPTAKIAPPPFSLGHVESTDLQNTVYVAENRMPQWETYDGGTPRAPRFDIRVPILYRSGEDHDWLSGRTLNISRSGVLFSCSSSLQPGTLVRFRMDLPDSESAELAGWGQIVRSAIHGEDSLLGVVLLGYHFEAHSGNRAVPEEVHGRTRS